MLTQLAAAIQLVNSVLGAADRRDWAPPPPLTASKPLKDWLPQVAAARASRVEPEAILSQGYLYAQQNAAPPPHP